MSIRKNERSYKSNLERKTVEYKNFLSYNTCNKKSFIVTNFRQIYRPRIFFDVHLHKNLRQS